MILLYRGQASDLWQKLDLASEPEIDLQDTIDWSKKWLVDFKARKAKLLSFDWSNNSGAIDLKMYGSVINEKSSFFLIGLGLLCCLYC